MARFVLWETEGSQHSTRKTWMERKYWKLFPKIQNFPLRKLRRPESIHKEGIKQKIFQQRSSRLYFQSSIRTQANSSRIDISSRWQQKRWPSLQIRSKGSIHWEKTSWRGCGNDKSYGGNSWNFCRFSAIISQTRRDIQGSCWERDHLEQSDWGKRRRNRRVRRCWRRARLINMSIMV